MTSRVMDLAKQCGIVYGDESDVLVSDWQIKQFAALIAAEAKAEGAAEQPVMRAMVQCQRHQGMPVTVKSFSAAPAVTYCPNCEDEDSALSRTADADGCCERPYRCERTHCPRAAQAGGKGKEGG